MKIFANYLKLSINLNCTKKSLKNRKFPENNFKIEYVLQNIVSKKIYIEKGPP